MGTHPIFESDFDCLTDRLKNGQSSSKVEGGKGQGGLRRWKKVQKEVSKGKVRDKLANMCLFDKATYDKVHKEVPNYKVITPSIVSDRMKIRGSLARRCIKELHAMGKIKLIVQHGAQMVYTRAIIPEEE